MSTQSTDLIVASVLAEEFSKGIAGMNVLDGTGAFTVNPGLQAGKEQVANDITVPYFTSIGKAQQVARGGALTPKKLEMTSETGTVIRLGDAVSISGWAQRAKALGRDLHEVATEMLLAGFKARVEDLCMDALVARAVAASMVYDGSAGIFNRDCIVGTQKKFGDELASGGGIALWAMQSKPYWDAANIADSTGRPLLVEAPGESLQRMGGKPVALSDRDSLLVASTSPQQYYTVAAKKGAGAVWINEGVTIESDRDILADDDLLAYHVYLVIHAYGTMPAGTKAGVAAAKSL